MKNCDAEEENTTFSWDFHNRKNVIIVTRTVMAKLHRCTDDPAIRTDSPIS